MCILYSRWTSRAGWQHCRLCYHVALLPILVPHPPQSPRRVIGRAPNKYIITINPIRQSYQTLPISRFFQLTCHFDIKNWLGALICTISKSSCKTYRTKTIYHRTTNFRTPVSDSRSRASLEELRNVVISGIYQIFSSGHMTMELYASLSCLQIFQEKYSRLNVLKWLVSFQFSRIYKFTVLWYCSPTGHRYRGRSYPFSEMDSSFISTYN